MDLGGTNLRIMLAQFAPDQPMTTKQFNSRIPNWALHGTGEQVSTETYFNYCQFAVVRFYHKVSGRISRRTQRRR